MVNEDILQKNSGESFIDGYAFKPSDSKTILKEAANLKTGETAPKQGHQLGHYTVGKNAKNEA